MKRGFGVRRSTRKSISAQPVQVQQLEARTLLTGTVSIQVSKLADVSIVGDDANNDIEVSIGATGISAKGLNGTKISYNGQTVNAGVAVQVGASSFIPRDLNVWMGKGNDRVAVNVTSNLTVRRDVNVDLGAGHDSLLFSTSAVTSVGGGVSVQGGAGDDSIILEATGVNGKINVTKSVAVDAGKGTNTVIIGNVDDVAGIVGAENAALPANHSGTPAVLDVQIGKDLSVTTDAGNDKVAIVGVAAGRDVSLDLKAGKGDILGINDLWVGRNMSVWSAEWHALLNMTVNGSAAIRSGDGVDQIAVDNATFKGEVVVTMGERDDFLAIGAGVVAQGKVKINGGRGTNTIESAVDLPGVKLKKVKAGSVNIRAIINKVVGAFV